MRLLDRLSYALIGFVFGALIGVACWWLYGLGLSLNYYGPAIDPNIKHWVGYIGGAFAALGFLFRGRVGDVIGDAIGAIFHFEAGETPGSNVSAWFALVFVGIVIMAIWFTTR